MRKILPVFLLSRMSSSISWRNFSRQRIILLCCLWQIAYYTGLRIGEVCGLTWQDINLEEQYLTVRRSMRYNGTRHTTEVGTTKRSKVRTVDFCDTLAAILRAARTEQRKNRFPLRGVLSPELLQRSKGKGRTYYEVYSLQRTEEVPEDYKEISLLSA